MKNFFKNLKFDFYYSYYSWRNYFENNAKIAISFEHKDDISESELEKEFEKLSILKKLEYGFYGLRLSYFEDLIYRDLEKTVQNKSDIFNKLEQMSLIKKLFYRFSLIRYSIKKEFAKYKNLSLIEKIYQVIKNNLFSNLNIYNYFLREGFFYESVYHSVPKSYAARRQDACNYADEEYKRISFSQFIVHALKLIFKSRNRTLDLYSNNNLTLDQIEFLAGLIKIDFEENHYYSGDRALDLAQLNKILALNKSYNRLSPLFLKNVFFLLEFGNINFEEQYLEDYDYAESLKLYFTLKSIDYAAAYNLLAAYNLDDFFKEKNSLLTELIDGINLNNQIQSKKSIKNKLNILKLLKDEIENQRSKITKVENNSMMNEDLDDV